VERAPLLHAIGHQIAFFFIGRMTAGDAQAGLPLQQVWTPWVSWRRSAVVGIGTHLDGWRHLDRWPFVEGSRPNPDAQEARARP
jgi:hypothetical protein